MRRAFTRQRLLAAIGASAISAVAMAGPQGIPLSTETLDAVRAELLLEDFTSVRLSVPAGIPDDVRIHVPVDGGYTLDLVRHSVRAADFTARVQLADGSIVQIEAPPVRTYRGTVDELPGAIVAASIVDGQITAMIQLLDGPSINIQPTSDASAAVGSDLHVVYLNTDVIEDEAYECGLDNDLHGDGHGAGGHDDSPFAPRGGCFYTAEIAFDADREFYVLNGSSVTNTINDIENVLNSINVIYNRDVDIDHVITDTLVRTAEPDPYGSTNSSALLDQFRNHWNASQQSVQRDVAHLMTGKNIQGSVIGVAYLSRICSQTQGYGLSQSRFTGNFAARVALTAHELGHNWGSGHCSGGSCNIMCAGLGGCSGNITFFSSSSINAITNHRNSRGCLDQGGGAAPTAGDDAVATFFDQDNVFDVLVNDNSECADELTIVLGTAFTSQGGFVGISTGTGPGGRDEVSYSPPHNISGNNFQGVDTFTYQVFDGSLFSSSATVTVDVLGPRQPDNPPFTAPGMNGSYYALTAPTSLPDFDSLTPINNEILSEIFIIAFDGQAVAGSGLTNNVGVLYDGYITVPDDANYTFTLSSDDGSRLLIGNLVVVDNDGVHGQVDISGDVSLLAGTHELRVEYFEATGSAILIASIEGGSLVNQIIPASMLSHEVPPPSCTADWNSDTIVNTSDFVAYLNDYNAVLGGGSFSFNDPDIAAPFGVLNTSDFIAFLNAFSAGCP